MNKKLHPASGIYLALVMLFLYLPIFMLIVLSFNGTNSTSVINGFSFKWYVELFRDSATINALTNTLVLAVTSAITATVIGTLAAVGIDKMKKGFVKSSVMTVTNIPMMNPDIVTGVSMMLLFVAAGTILGTSGSFGFGTLLIAHVTFDLPYVILSVLPRFKTMDRSLSEAAQDLGCTPSRAFFLVELPEIVPGIVSGLMMSFTLSLDDFVISHFVSSPDFQTLPLYVYNQTAHNVKFSMYALCALIVVIILAVLLVVNFAGSFKSARAKRREGRIHA